MPRTIQAWLDQIITASRGEEVREAIHESIAQCYDDVDSSVTLASAQIDRASDAADAAEQAAELITGGASSVVINNFGNSGALVMANSAINGANNAATTATNAAGLITNGASSAIISNYSDENDGVLKQAYDFIIAANIAAQSVSDAIDDLNDAHDAHMDAIEEFNIITETLEDDIATIHTAEQVANNLNAVVSDANAVISEWGDSNSGLQKNISDAINAANTAASAITNGASQSLINEYTQGSAGALVVADTLIDNLQAAETTINTLLSDENPDGIIATLSEVLTEVSSARVAAENANALIDSIETLRDDPVNGWVKTVSDAQSAITDMEDLRDEIEDLRDDPSTGLIAAKNNCVAATSAAASATVNTLAATDRANNAVSALAGMTVRADNGDTASATASLINEGSSSHWHLEFILPRGQKGEDFIIKGDAFASVEDLIAGVASPEEGDLYNVGTSEPYDVYRWTGLNWENQGPIGFRIENLTNNEVNTLWTSGTAVSGESSKYVTGQQLDHLLNGTDMLKDTLDGKVDVVSGKGLSTNDLTDALLETINDSATAVSALQLNKVDVDGNKVLSDQNFTTALKNKLDGIEAQANKITVDSALNANSANPVRNSVVTSNLSTLETNLMNALAPAYDDTVTHAVGEFRIYNKKLYKCTGAVNYANNGFDPAKWQEVQVSEMLGLGGISGIVPVANGGTGNSSVDTTPTANSTKMVTSDGVKTALDAKLNLSGGTMTGMLYMNSTSPGMISKVTNKNTSTAVSTSTNSYGYRIVGSDNNVVALFTDTFYSDGRTGAWMCGYRMVGNTNVNNTLRLLVKSDGTPEVQVTNAAAWRTAIAALGTAGGTTTGPITYQPSTGVSYIQGSAGSGTAIYSKKTALNTRAYNPAVTVQTYGGGGWAMGNYDTEDLLFSYGSKANIDGGNNQTVQIKFTSSGGVNFPGTIQQNGTNVSLAGHTHAMSAITSGVLGIAQGGTGQTTLALARNAMGLGNTTGALPVANGGTGLAASPSLLVNLASTSAANVLQASPRPGVTGILPVGNGGTGQTSLQATRNAMGLGNTTGALPIANGGTGGTTQSTAKNNLGIRWGVNTAAQTTGTFTRNFYDTDSNNNKTYWFTGEPRVACAVKLYSGVSNSYVYTVTITACSQEGFTARVDSFVKQPLTVNADGSGSGGSVHVSGSTAETSLASRTIGKNEVQVSWVAIGTSP